MPLETEPATAEQLSLGLDGGDGKRDSPRSPTHEAAAREIADGVRHVVVEAFAGRNRQMSPEAMSTAFLRDLMRVAEEQNIELSEQDYDQLLKEAVALEAAVRASEMIRGSFEALLATTPARETTLSMGVASFPPLTR